MKHKSELIYYSKLCYERGFITAYDGNLSIKLTNNTILTTASGINKGKIASSQLVMVNMNGKVLKGSDEPTKELMLHLFIYEKRKDIKAIIHSHPVFCTAFAVAGIALDKITLPEVFLKLSKIPLAPWGTPHTNELPISIKKFVMKYNAVLLSNHGLVTYGKSLEDAYCLTEKAEQFAKVSFYARMLGGERELTKQQQKKLKDIK